MGFSFRHSILRILPELICFLYALALFAQAGPADTAAWLRYAPLDSKAAMDYEKLPATSVVLGKSLILENEKRELAAGVEKTLGRPLKSSVGLSGRAVLLSTIRDLRRGATSRPPPRPL